MYKKWKSVAALGMAVLIGCMMPVDTMIVAAEEYPEAGEAIEVDSASDDEAVLDDEKAGDDGKDDENENAGDELKTDENENAGDEENADNNENAGDEGNEDGENADDEINAGEDEHADDEIDIGNYGIALMAEAGDIVAPASIDAPKIEIKWNGEPYTYDLGGPVDFKYVNINKVNQTFECSASQGALLYYCLEQVWPDKAAKDDNSMPPMDWKEEQPSFSGDNAHYILYVKAVGEDGQITYARSGGIVVDTESPEVIGVENGKSYPEGTQFKVKDNIDLESVTVNGIPVSDGSYQVSANGTSCVIKAKDKAGNETICRINVSRNPADNVIRESGIYTLEAGTSYELAAGEWQVGGDKSVYSGGITFYVKADGDYTFTKR